jgi:hypothetical protein
LWELITCELPFDEFPFCQWPAQLEDSIMSGTRPTIPSFCVPSYKKLIAQCWHHDPKQRPSFSSVLSSLINIKSQWLQGELLSHTPSSSPLSASVSSDDIDASGIAHCFIQ